MFTTSFLPLLLIYSKCHFKIVIVSKKDPYTELYLKKLWLLWFLLGLANAKTDTLHGKANILREWYYVSTSFSIKSCEGNKVGL